MLDGVGRGNHDFRSSPYSPIPPLPHQIDQGERVEFNSACRDCEESGSMKLKALQDLRAVLEIPIALEWFSTQL
jgi:hypothetical protein